MNHSWQTPLFRNIFLFKKLYTFYNKFFFKVLSGFNVERYIIKLTE